MEENKVLYSEVEAFILNNKAVSKIQSHISNFNPIKVMKMEGMEIRHSRILGWLLDPLENHGLHDEFTKKFFSEALRGDEIKGVRSLDIQSISFQNANVYIEWNNIDIFVEIADEKLAFIVENKVYSKQGKKQLTNYRGRIEERFPDYKIIGVFLTLNEETPDDAFYCQIYYERIGSLLGEMLDQLEGIFSAKVFNFLKDYEEIVNELTGMNKKQNEMEQMARSIYQGNKKVLDFLFKHGKKDEFEFAIEKFIAGENNIERYQNFTVSNQDYTFLYSSKNWYRFIPVSWINVLGEVSHQDWSSEEFKWKGCENWFPYPIVCWFQLIDQNTVSLVVEVGCLEDYEMRQELIKSIETAFPKAKFTSKAYLERTKYSRFMNISSELEDIQDEEGIRNKLTELLTKNFVEPSKAIEEGLRSFMNAIE